MVVIYKGPDGHVDIKEPELGQLSGWLAQVAPVGPIRRYRVIRNQPDPPPDDLKDKIMENEEIKKELERRREGK